MHRIPLFCLLAGLLLFTACEGTPEPAVTADAMTRSWTVTAYDSPGLHEALGDTYTAMREANMAMVYALTPDSVKTYFGTSELAGGTWTVEGRTLTLAMENEPEPILLTIAEHHGDEVSFTWQRRIDAVDGSSVEVEGTTVWRATDATSN